MYAAYLFLLDPTVRASRAARFAARSQNASDPVPRPHPARLLPDRLRAWVGARLQPWRRLEPRSEVPGKTLSPERSVLW